MINTMTFADRRKLLTTAAASFVAVLTGCGGSDAEPVVAASSSSPPPSPGAPATWNPNVPPLVVGSGAVFNLASTLPAGVAAGGAFGVDSNGAQLPFGMTLSSAGILAVGSATAGSVSGVIFKYESN